MKTNLIALITLIALTFNGYSQNVGIGTLTPAHKLDVSGAIRATGTIYCGTDFELNGAPGIGNLLLNDKPIILRSGADLSHKIVYKASINGIEITGNNAVQLRTTSGDVLTVKADKVGIGSGATNPAYRLDVDGNAHVNSGLRVDGVISNDPCPGGCQFAELRKYSWSDNVTGLRDVGLWVDKDIRTLAVHCISDERIKDVIGVSNADNDLSTLMSIEVTNYRHKDVRDDYGVVKKVIAQQVESIYPEAVSLGKDFIPDVYQFSTSTDGFIALPVADLKAGDKLKLIFEDDSELQANVTAVNEDGFFVDNSKSGEVFVYGRFVEDFRSVDYEAISMLNVSATQEQQRLIESLEDRIKELEKENASLKTDYNTRLEAIESKLGLGLEVMNK